MSLMQVYNSTPAFELSACLCHLTAASFADTHMAVPVWQIRTADRHNGLAIGDTVPVEDVILRVAPYYVRMLCERGLRSVFVWCKGTCVVASVMH